MTILRHLFANPWMLAGFAALPLLGLLAWRAAIRRRRVLAAFGYWPSVQALISSPGRFRKLSLFLATLGLVLLIVACAGPQWGRDFSQAATPGRDLVLVLDVSRSMLAEQPSRFSHAREALGDLIATLRRRGGQRVALVAFAGQARTLCPLTHDYDHVAEILDGIDPELLAGELRPAGNAPSGTRIGLGLREALALLDPRFAGAQDILLISDGDDPAHDNDWIPFARQAATRSIPIHTAGVGDSRTAGVIPGITDEEGQPVHSRPNDRPLEELASGTGGFHEPVVVRLENLGERYREAIRGKATREDAEDVLPVYHSRSAWFFAAALAAFTMEMLLATFGSSPSLQFKRSRSG